MANAGSTRTDSVFNAGALSCRFSGGQHIRIADCQNDDASVSAQSRSHFPSLLASCTSRFARPTVVDLHVTSSALFLALQISDAYKLDICELLHPDATKAVYDM
jgi:hypothetical protein